HDRVGARTLVRRPRTVDDHDVGRVDLVGGEQPIRCDAERHRHAGAVLRDAAGDVARANPGIEAGIDAFGHAAVAGEERMTDARERCKRGGLQPARVVPGLAGRRVDAGAHTSKPGRTSSCGLARITALIMRPMPVGSSLVRRASAVSIAPTYSGGAPALSA